MSKHTPEEINTDLLKAVDTLPKWLREVADVLELKAQREGMTSVLNPKLKWYADRIDAAIAKATQHPQHQTP